MNPSPLPSWSAASRFVCRACGLALVAIATSTTSAASLSISLQQVDRNNPTIAQGTLGTFDLTAGGLALDWLKPVGSNLSLAEKDLANALNFSTLGTTFTPSTYANDGYTFSWSGGDSGSISGTSFQGSNESSTTVGRGFRLNFVAPAPGDYTVTYYSAANGDLTKYRLTGFLDTTQLDAKSASANLGSDSVDELIWTVQINADAANQNFNLDLTRQTGATSSAIAITGANVVAAPEPTGAALLLLGAVTLGKKRRQR